MEKNIVNFNSVKAAKEFMLNANARIGELEHALYKILDQKRLDVIHELAADVLGEDLEVYLEDDCLEELDFEDEPTNSWDDYR